MKKINMFLLVALVVVFIVAIIITLFFFRFGHLYPWEREVKESIIIKNMNTKNFEVNLDYTNKIVLSSNVKLDIKSSKESSYIAHKLYYQTIPSAMRTTTLTIEVHSKTRGIKKHSFRTTYYEATSSRDDYLLLEYLDFEREPLYYVECQKIDYQSSGKCLDVRSHEFYDYIGTNSNLCKKISELEWDCYQGANRNLGEYYGCKMNKFSSFRMFTTYNDGCGTVSYYADYIMLLPLDGSYAIIISKNPYNYYTIGIAFSNNFAQEEERIPGNCLQNEIESCDGKCYKYIKTFLDENRNKQKDFYEINLYILDANRDGIWNSDEKVCSDNDENGHCDCVLPYYFYDSDGDKIPDKTIENLETEILQILNSLVSLYCQQNPIVCK